MLTTITGQIQAPTGSYPAAPEETSVAPAPYTSIASVSVPPVLSSAYSSIVSVTPVPLPVPINTTTAVVAPSYPAGNATVIAPTGSGTVPTTAQTSAGSGSETSADAVGGSASETAGSPQQTDNAAGIVGVETGVLAAVFAGLLAFLA